MYGGRFPEIGRRDARWGRSYNDYASNYMASNRYTNNNSTYGRGNGTIKVSGIDMFIKYNTQAHHTNEFDITNAHVYGARDEVLVVRRGQQFFMRIRFNRPYDATRDDIRLVYQFGKTPSSSKERYVELFLSARSKPSLNDWKVSIHSQDGDSVTLAVVAPPTCAVGKWSLRVDVVKSVLNNKPTVLSFEYRNPVYILFNPWCKDDQVYMKEEDLLGEYILNETGKLYSGSKEKITHFPWNFGQFSGHVLECVMYLLDERSGLPDHLRGDPVQVSRRISSLVNSSDNSGVLIGNWSGNYGDGTSPLSWTGSVDILEEYYSTKRPVKYGQCWVFSGVATTVCRALGIPARSVTNFSSAHDTDGSMTIDKYFNTDLKEIEDLNHDSVWNFHVWNDVWMARPDLPRGYGGWQAIDATPQETSGGIYCMGPMSLTAIKYGHVNLQYDGPFAFAEVNGDKIMWMRYAPGKMRVMKIDKSIIGKFISTKKPLAHSTINNWMAGSDVDREDITDQYKFKEGTKAERTAVQKASHQSSIDNVYETSKKDVDFELSVDKNTFIGEPLKIVLRVKNRSKTTRTISGHLRVTTMLYTGATHKSIVNGNIQKIVLTGSEDVSFGLEVPAAEYLDKLTDHCFFSLTFSCMVEETNQTTADTVEGRLRKPHLRIETPDVGYVGQIFRVQASFKNTLPVKLTNCQLRVEGPGKQRPVTYNVQGIYTGQTFAIDMTPVKPGEKEIIINFNCDQLYAVNASHPIYIKK
ncbi:protein-glutamine gamma-glutamyltransferase K-like [Mercenaria mercenaria]|uniref:protein-glutamine gamma-glutamyltransferase K-like n=1 Tax=Mercenaria mercenaria TaxID=6596 RepID=UPI00234EB28A|nr:protein-glutamine gamma-glutamyltransferase K-like [Mercenaria mercenaria]XP_053404052.1 protein-glutamine gamma-glutamyltransferase K-like [Mercenaria mercenaria]